jgi:hypothetical protein
LIPNPSVSYSSPNSTGALNFTPASNASGTATITVTVNDGQSLNNLVSQSFLVTVSAPVTISNPSPPTIPPTPPNYPPTLNSIGNVTLNAKAGSQSLNLSGITSGSASENQTLTVTAASSNPSLIPNPSVSYASPNSTGALTFTPASNASGTATITVTVNDGQALNNLVSQSFLVTVSAPVSNSNPTPPPTYLPTMNPIGGIVLASPTATETVTLNGITIGSNPSVKKTKLKITATSNNSTLIKKAAVNYKSPGSMGTLSLKLNKKATGTATVTVTANNGRYQVQQTFMVTVGSGPVAATSVKLVSAMAKFAATAPADSVLIPAAPVDGKFALTFTGVANHQYVIEASDNMKDWTPVTTNTASSFTFVDTDSGKFNQRFYRAVSIP